MESYLLCPKCHEALKRGRKMRRRCAGPLSRFSLHGMCSNAAVPYDVIVVGGGLAGAAMALVRFSFAFGWGHALSELWRVCVRAQSLRTDRRTSELRVAVIEPSPPKPLPSPLPEGPFGRYCFGAHPLLVTPDSCGHVGT